MVLLLLNIFIIILLGAVLIKLRHSKENTQNIDADLEILINKVNSIRYGNLSIKIPFKQNKLKRLSESISRLADALNDREKMIREYQSELTRQNMIREAIINSLSDGMLIVDSEYKILVVTPQVIEWFGLNKKEIIGKSIFDFVKSKAKKISFDEEEIYINNLNDVFMSTIKPLNLNNKGQFVIILKNITNQKEIEQLKDDFIATLTHDLKVPIIAESNILDFLLQEKFGKISEKQLEALSNIKHSNAEMQELVQILLETYKAEKSGLELIKETVNLNEFTQEIITEMKVISEKEGLKVNFCSDEKVSLDIDKIHFKRVLKNLIQNAIAHSDTKKDIDVTIEKDEKQVYIRVVDYGKGISDVDKAHIFKKYYSTAKKFRKIGTGLGLYLSSQIVKAHGGEITVTSKANTRTEFCIKVPV